MKKPLLDALKKYLQDDLYPLCNPGHKGRSWDADFAAVLQQAAKLDIGQMTGLGDMPNSAEVVAEAEQLAAKLYGSDACFWCLNGETEAVFAMILGAVQPGEKVLITRDSNISVFNALFLAHADPVFVQPQFNKEFGIPTQVRPKDVEEVLSNNRGIKAMVLTSPNYYGVTADIASIAYVCHKHGALLLVDETHGAHLGFSKDLPASAMRSDADACAQGTYRTLGAVSQASVLHVKKKNVDMQRIANAVSMLNSINKNYLLMASLDGARAQLEEYGDVMMQTALTMADKLKNTAKVAGLRVLEPEDVPGFGLDTTKVLVNLNNFAISGKELAERLRKERIAVELVDDRNVLFLITYADETPEFYDMLIRLRKVFMHLKASDNVKNDIDEVPPQTEVVMDIGEVFYAPAETISLADCEGRIAAETVAFYPPGIPVLLPGEKISAEILAYILKQKECGAVVKGTADIYLDTIRVVKE